MDFQMFLLKVFDLSLQGVKMGMGNLREISAERQTILDGDPSYAALKRANGFADKLQLGALLLYDASGNLKPDQLAEISDLRNQLSVETDYALKREKEAAAKGKETA